MLLDFLILVNQHPHTHVKFWSSWGLLHRYFYWYLKGIYHVIDSRAFLLSLYNHRPGINFLLPVAWRFLEAFEFLWPVLYVLSGCKDLRCLYMLGAPQTKITTFSVARVDAQGKFRNPRGRIGNLRNNKGKKANLKCKWVNNLYLDGLMEARC